MDQTTLANKLMGPISTVLDKHRADIGPMLAGKPAEVLKNDDTVRTVAGYTYALLPGLVRLAVKEPVFVDFVLNNREKVLAKMVASAG
jgi:hypothetical protein